MPPKGSPGVLRSHRRFPTRRLEIDPVTPLTIDVTADGSVCRLVLAGELDLTTSPLLHDRAAAELRAGRDVELELAAVGFVDSSALSVLVAIHRQAQELGARFAVREPLPPQMRRVLEVTGLLTRLPIAPAGPPREGVVADPEA